MTESVSNENVKRILALLRSGDEKINLSGYRNVILVIGNTGSGKSTLTHFLGGNNDELISSEVGENSGEFIISDNNNKISVNSTVISKTTFPELIVDAETKLVFIDCPGFNDSRNEAYDIAAAYFIKKVLENVKNVKIILTVSYPSLRKGVNRIDFLQLLEHVGILIKNIEKYVDGVALIATKVDNTYTFRNGVASMVPDTSIIQNIGQFLLEVRESTKTMKNLDQVYTSEFKRAENEVFFESSRKLLDTLLQKNGTEYNRLGIFRRPDGPGRISDSKLLQHGKKVLKKMIKNNVKYVPVDMSDIGYAVSDKSKNIIRDLVEEIDTNIIADVAQVNNVLINHLKEMEVKLIHDDMYSLRDHFKATSKASAQISSISESAKADEFVSVMQANLSESCKRASESSLNDIKNLNKFLNFLQEVSDKQFESSAWKWVKELEQAINYVENSLKWYDFLAALHKRLSEYEIQKNTKRFHIPKFESGSGLLESFVDFTNFFNEISSAEFLKVVNLKELQKVNIDDTKIRYFNQVIESTLRDSVNYTVDESGQRLQAAGEYIKLSDVVARAEYRWAKSVQILAKHTVFIDADLKVEIDISIIAPNWDIIGSRTISLDGSSGGHHDVPKASDGDVDGDLNGQDGLPGKPGQSAGHFFGLGDQFKGAESLTIRAIGGTGGFGQHGGDGAPGTDGKSHEIRNHQYYIRCDRDQECSTDIEYAKSGLFNLNVKGKVSFTKYGAVGGRGGNAGHGGAPGIGGNAGSITLLSLGNMKPPVSLRLGKGQDGGFGIHGDCGTGGRGGNNQKAWYHFGTWKDTENWVDRFAGRANDGEMGTCLHYSAMYNSNYEDRKEPAIKEFLYPPSFVLSDFRNVLIDNLNNSVKKHHSLELYKTLQKEEIIQYDSVELIFNELQTLEKHCNQFSPEINQFLYTLLMERIRESAKTSDHKTFIDFLSLAVSSELIRLQNKSESRLIYNSKTYFDFLKTADVTKIHDFFLSRNQQEIGSTKTFLKVIRDHIFDTIAKTTGEIVRLSQQDIDNELSNQLLKLKLFFNLRTIEEFLMFATSLAEADVSLVNNLSLISALPLAEVSMPPVDGSKISALLYIIEKPIKFQIEAIRSSVSKEREALEALGMEFDEIVYRLRDIETSLESRVPFAAESYVHPAFSKITDISRSLFNINGALMNEANVRAREATDKLDQDLMLIKFDANIYNALKTKEIDTLKLIDSIDEYPDRALHIDETATELFNVIGPVFHSVRNSLAGDMYKPANLSELRAMVLQALSDLKLVVYKFIDQFEIDEDLQLIVENMDEAISQMTSIFSGVLTSHEDRTKLSSYSKYLEKEKELGNHHQNYLIDLVKANTLVYEYERLVDIYKKLTSPFDVLILDTPPLPPLGQSISAYRNSFITNVKIFESKLESLEQSSKNDTISDDFDSTNQNGAFFVWKKDNYKESISKLLYGRAVALKASNSNKNQQFLKFDDIKLRFKASDPNMQQSLDEDMQNFNVIMTHTGNSYYSLCDRITLISQDATKFVYNVNETVTQVDPNDGPIKPALSPYTTWIFQLIPVDENVTFSSLIPYRKSGIDVELEGHATFFSTQNKTMCQKITHGSFETNQPPSTSTGFTNQASLIRKRREIYSSEEVFDSKPLKSWNPFNYLVGREPNPEFNHFSNVELLESNDIPNQPTTFSPSLNVNAALTLVDFMARKIFKVKPSQTREKSANAEEARVIALNILHKYENMLVELSEGKLVSMSDWEQQDPVEMMNLLEKYILTEDYPKIIDVLSHSVTLEPSVEVQLRQELVQVVNQSLDGPVLRNEYEDNYGSARTEGVLFDDFTNGADFSSYDNFNRSLLN